MPTRNLPPIRFVSSMNLVYAAFAYLEHAKSVLTFGDISDAEQRLKERANVLRNTVLLYAARAMDQRGAA